MFARRAVARPLLPGHKSKTQLCMHIVSDQVLVSRRHHDAHTSAVPRFSPTFLQCIFIGHTMAMADIFTIKTEHCLLLQNQYKETIKRAPSQPMTHSCSTPKRTSSSLWSRLLFPSLLRQGARERILFKLLQKPARYTRLLPNDQGVCLVAKA